MRPGSQEVRTAKEIKSPVFHPVSAAFGGALDYRTYLLFNFFLRYNGKKTARAAKLAEPAKLMVRIRNPYKFEDSDPVTALSFQRQFERACDFNGRCEVWLCSFCHS